MLGSRTAGAVGRCSLSLSGSRAPSLHRLQQPLALQQRWAVRPGVSSASLVHSRVQIQRQSQRQGGHQRGHRFFSSSSTSSSSGSSSAARRRGMLLGAFLGVSVVSGAGVFLLPGSEAFAEPFSMPDDDLDAVDMPHVVVFAGGSGFNEAAYKLRDTDTHVSYIMPISDDGGSSAEIQRVLGGPSIGDIRARLVRLAAQDTKEHRAIKELLLYRLPSDGPDDKAARQEWASLVEGNHELWKDVSPAYKSTIRRFFVVFQDLVWNKSQRRTFDFRGGCMGNFFLTGSRVFFDSVEAAIVWFSAILRIPPSNVVVPVIATNRRVAIGCCLKDTTEILGQHNISHPPMPIEMDPLSTEAQVLDSHATFAVNKDVFLPLSSPIDRVFYINQDQQPITPKINPRALDVIKDADHVVYGMGSLYTSIIPSLILPGVAEAVRSKGDMCRKVLILNGKSDRETTGMGVLDMVTAVARGLTRYHYPSREAFPLREFHYYINTLIVPENKVLTSEEETMLRAMQIEVIKAPMASNRPDEWQYDDQSVVDFLVSLPKVDPVHKSLNQHEVEAMTQNDLLQ